MIKINLLGDALAQAVSKKPDKFEAAQVYAQGEGTGRSSLPIAGLLVGLVLASTGLVYYLWLNREVDLAQQKKASLEQQKQGLEPYIKLEQTFRSQKEALQKKEDVISGLKKNQQLPVHFMEEVANSLPDDVWFKSVIQKGMSVTVTGESTSFEAVQLFRNHLLERSRWFKNVNYPTGGKRPTSNIVDFTISFDLQNPA